MEAHSYVLPDDTSAMPLLPNGNGSFRLGWSTKLRRGTSVQICDYFNSKIAKVRVEDEVYFLSLPASLIG
jgi:hypothetical protein